VLIQDTTQRGKRQAIHLGRPKPHPVILSEAKDLKKVAMDAVECRDNDADGSAHGKKEHLRSFTAFRMTEGCRVQHKRPSRIHALY
jgi:hypothetical protein